MVNDLFFYENDKQTGIDRFAVVHHFLRLLLFATRYTKWNVIAPTLIFWDLKPRLLMWYNINITINIAIGSLNF